MKKLKEFFSENKESFDQGLRIALLFATVGLIVITMTTVLSDYIGNEKYKIDEVAKRTVRSPKKFTIKDALVKKELMVRRGEVIVRAVDVITKDQASKLNHVFKTNNSKINFRTWVSYSILSILGILSVFYFSLKMITRAIKKWMITLMLKVIIHLILS